MLRNMAALMLISSASIGGGCAVKNRVVIPSAPIPTTEQIEAIEECAAYSVPFAAIEKRRIIHSCQIEVLKDPRDDFCVELLEELEREADDG